MSASRGGPNKSSPSGDSMVFHYDAGSVFAGETITHTFVFDNPLRREVLVADNGDIRSSCGCTSLRPAHRRIEPRGSTQVLVNLDTSGRNGTVSDGGLIIWSTANGRQVKSVFRVAAIVEPAIRVDPSHVFFDEKEVASGIAKEIVFAQSPNLTVDWSTLRLSSSSEHVRIIHTSRATDAGRCAIRCSVPPDVGNVTATIVASASVASDSVTLPGKEVSAHVSVRGEHPVELAWRPRLVPVRFVKSTAAGSGQLFLWGRNLKGGSASIKSITCDGHNVQFSTRTSAGEVTVVDIRLSRLSDQVRNLKGALVVRVTGDRVVSVPFFLANGTGSTRFDSVP